MNRDQTLHKFTLLDGKNLFTALAQGPRRFIAPHIKNHEIMRGKNY